MQAQATTLATAQAQVQAQAPTLAQAAVSPTMQMACLGLVSSLALALLRDLTLGPVPLALAAQLTPAQAHMATLEQGQCQIWHHIIEHTLQNLPWASQDSSTSCCHAGASISCA